MRDHGHDRASSNHHLAFESPEMAAFSEVEGEVLIGFVEQGIGLLDELARRGGVDVRRVVDIGSGPGVATACLAQRFETANVVAVDGSTAMLERATARAVRLGLADRVSTHRTDLPHGLEALEPADVAWASMVLHHVGDEREALRRIRAIIRPNGLLVIVERAAPVRVLLTGNEREQVGLWERIDAAWANWFADMRADLTGATPSAAYPEMLEEAGFEVLANELLTLVFAAPLDDHVRRFAHTQLLKTRAQLERYADEADVAALLARSDEGAVSRADAQVRATRNLYVARTTFN